MRPPFSSRTAWDQRLNSLAAALRARRARGEPVFDLTESNPTRCGLVFEGERIRAALERAAILTYDPDPKGLRRAREAVAALYEGAAAVTADRIVLTAGTSEAYAYLFRLLADPGDEILVPAPCYPLFDFLARLNDVELRSYPLIEEEAFRIDIDRLRECAGQRARAILVVSPGNPTGAFLKRDERNGLDLLCAERGLALIADEVFSDYGFGSDPSRVASCVTDRPRALTFALGGLSKMLALPQMKVAWIAAAGPEEALGDAMRRLEVIADTYLSVNTPVQTALPDLLTLRPSIQAGVRARLDANRRTLDRILAPPHPAHALPSEGGWSAIVRVPATRSDEEWALDLLEEGGVLVQPGYLYDFPGEGRLVVSLLPDEGTFRFGLELIAARLAK